MKKITSLLLVLIMTFSMLSLAVSATPDLVVGSGDIDGDGDVNEFDYLVVKRAYFGTYTLTSGEISAADVDQNGSVDQLDYLCIKRQYFGTYNIGEDSISEDILTAYVVDCMSFEDELTFSKFTISQESEQLKVFSSDDLETLSLGVVGTNMYLIDTYEKYVLVKQYFMEEQTIDEDFFDENLLLSTAITASGSGYHYDFNKVSADEGKIVISIGQCSPYIASDAAHHENFITVALKKSEANGYDMFDVSFAPVFHILNKNPSGYYDTEPRLILSVEDSKILAMLLEELEWTADVRPDCDFDYHFVQDSLYHYHSESGTLYDEHREYVAALSDEEKAVIDKYLK